MTDISSRTWDPLTRALHWLSAIFILGMIADGYWMNHFVAREGKLAQFHWHVFFGVYFALLVMIRILSRLRGNAPLPPDGLPVWQTLASKAVHGIIYLIIVVIPVAGWISWSARARRLPVYLFGTFQVPWFVSAPDTVLEHKSEDVHIYLAYTLLALVVLHVVAALHHHLVRRNDVLTSMLGR